MSGWLWALNECKRIARSMSLVRTPAWTLNENEPEAKFEFSDQADMYAFDESRHFIYICEQEIIHNDIA